MATGSAGGATTGTVTGPTPRGGRTPTGGGGTTPTRIRIGRRIGITMRRGPGGGHNEGSTTRGVCGLRTRNRSVSSRFRVARRNSCSVATCSFSKTSSSAVSSDSSIGLTRTSRACGDGGSSTFSTNSAGSSTFSHNNHSPVKMSDFFNSRSGNISSVIRVLCRHTRRRNKCVAFSSVGETLPNSIDSSSSVRTYRSLLIGLNVSIVSTHRRRSCVSTHSHSTRSGGTSGVSCFSSPVEVCLRRVNRMPLLSHRERVRVYIRVRRSRHMVHRCFSRFNFVPRLYMRLVSHLCHYRRHCSHIVSSSSRDAHSGCVRGHPCLLDGLRGVHGTLFSTRTTLITTGASGRGRGTGTGHTGTHTGFLRVVAVPGRSSRVIRRTRGIGIGTGAGTGSSVTLISTRRRIISGAVHSGRRLLFGRGMLRALYRRTRGLFCSRCGGRTSRVGGLVSTHGSHHGCSLVRTRRGRYSAVTRGFTVPTSRFVDRFGSLVAGLRGNRSTHGRVIGTGLHLIVSVIGGCVGHNLDFLSLVRRNGANLVGTIRGFRCAENCGFSACTA